VERVNDTALEDRPEAFNRLSVDRADNLLVFRIVNGAMREFRAGMLIADPFDRCEQPKLYGKGSAADRRHPIAARPSRWAHDFNTDRNMQAIFRSLPGASFVVNGATPAADTAHHHLRRNDLAQRLVGLRQRRCATV
jgi:hypothetical protein